MFRDEEQGISLSLEHIQRSLDEESAKGAFYCEYPVFRDLFQLERRAIERTGDSIYLEESIRSSLRCSDVFTRYSISQYLILLPTITSEMGEMVLKRIISNFRKIYNRKDLMVDFRLQPLLPRVRPEQF